MGFVRFRSINFNQHFIRHRDFMGELTTLDPRLQRIARKALVDAVLKLTTSHYYLPAGKCIHREENSTEWGVDPHLTIEMTPEQMAEYLDQIGSSAGSLKRHNHCSSASRLGFAMPARCD